MHFIETSFLFKRPIGFSLRLFKATKEVGKADRPEVIIVIFTRIHIIVWYKELIGTD